MSNNITASIELVTVDKSVNFVNPAFAVPLGTSIPRKGETLNVRIKTVNNSQPKYALFEVDDVVTTFESLEENINAAVHNINYRLVVRLVPLPSFN